MVLTLALFTGPAQGAIAFDASTTHAATEITTTSFSHTCSGSNRILIVGITSKGGSVSSVSYNGTAMTLLSSGVQGEVSVAMYYLVAPATGAHNVSITMNSTRTIAVGANSYTGVDQVNPFYSFGSASGTSATSSVTIPSVTGHLVVDVLGTKEANPTPGAGQTQRTERVSSENFYHSTSDEAGAASVTMSYTHSNKSFFIIAGSMQPVSTSTLGYLGPGGVGDFLTNMMWLRADAEAYSDAGTTLATNGTGVRQWKDQSGNSRHANQTTSVSRPLYKTNAANGYPALRFTGNLFIDGPSPGISSTSGYTYLIAFRDTTTSTGAMTDGSGHFILDRTSATNNLVSLKPATGNFYGYQKRNDAGGGLGGPLTTTSINTNSKIIEMRRNYNVNYRIYYNNSLQATLAETDGATTPPNPRIGRHTSTSNGGIRGYIYEFIIYNTAINAARTIIVNNYLAAKYGLSLTADDLYDEDALGYDHEVAGIGQASDGTNHTDAKGTGAVRMYSPNNLGNSEFLIWGHNNGAMSSFGITDLPSGIQARLARDWAASEVGEVGTTTISFDLSGVFGGITASDLRLLIDDDGVYATGATSISGAVDLGGGVYQWSGIDIDNNNHFTVGSINSSQTPLPVELLEFRALLSERMVVELEWTTASETSNDYFTIERSVDGEKWTGIMRVEGSGNSNSHKTYHAVDNDPLVGISYYRLKQTDIDGEFSYSEIEEVQLNSNKVVQEQLSVAPNPTDGLVTIHFNENPSLVRILNLSGRDILSKPRLLIKA
ncbi:MAG: hypothetical protein R2813_11795 [Flavobacteriales bacterium]